MGLSYSGQNNFNRKTERAVNNSSSSLTDVYAVQSQGWKPEELGIFDAGPFYDTYLLYQTGDEVYHSILETADPQPELVNQHISIKEDGYQGEFALAFGTNYRDKLYMGTMLGVQLLRYKMRSAYTETASENAPSLLDNFTFNEYQKTKGVGINLKFGVIYRPVSQIRLGVAIHSPAWFALKHTLETAVHSCFTTETDPSIGRESADYLISTKDYGEYYDPYEYLIRLNTPWRAVFSFATVLGKRLILSMDYEYVNYRAAKYKHPVSWMYKVAAGKDLASWEYTDEDDDEDEDTWEEDKMRDLSELIDYGPINEAIKDIYRSAHHFRAGAEIRVTSVVSLRGGYGFQNSPYAGDSGRNNQIRSVSGGLGLNFGLIYGDISYARHRSENESRFYDYENIRALPVHNQLTNHEVRLTVGVRFSSDGGGIPGIIQEIF